MVQMVMILEGVVEGCNWKGAEVVQGCRQMKGVEGEGWVGKD